MTRAYCYQCNKAKQACLCNLTAKINNKVNIHVLQHPTEVKNTKGSAIIAKLYLQNYQCLIGEDFSENDQLNTLINKHFDNTYLIYPSDGALSFKEFLRECIIEIDGVDKCEKMNLIFIDASWRKASKIWHLSSNLHLLRCVTLNTGVRSSYRIRKQPEDDYLSTIEAIVVNLSNLENNSEKYQPLLDVFKKMIDFQINKMGDEVYRRNYID